MITIYILTYTGNGPEAVECVACAGQTFPEARVIVADDSNAPMPEPYRDACSYGADIITTDFDRGLNLNGPEAVRGILSLLSQDAAEDDIVLKLDPDTALIGRSWLQPMLDDSSVPFTAGPPSNPPTGAATPSGAASPRRWPPSCRTRRFLPFARRTAR